MRRNNGEFARVTLIPAIGSYRASIEAVPMNGVGPAGAYGHGGDRQ